MEHRLLEMQVKQIQKAKAAPPPPAVHHEGKGTRARLDTAAEKAMFGTRISK